MARSLAILALISVAGVATAFGPATPTAAVSAAASAAVGAAQAAPWKIDAVHSSVVFRVKHLNTSWFYGSFEKIDGTVVFNEADPSKSSINFTVDVNSVRSANDKRDGHLKGEDFFAAGEFPKATFKSKSFSKTGENAYSVTGDFTLRGVTKEITVPLEKTGASNTPRFGNRVGFETTFTINRLDYGVKYMPEGLGTDVRITAAFAAVEG